MKVFALSFFAASIVSSVAFADVLGVNIQDGYTIRYERVSEYDNGLAEMDVCTTSVLNEKGVVLATKNIDLTATPEFCGRIARNGVAEYAYSVEYVDGFREESCFRTANGRAPHVMVGINYCGKAF